MAYLLGIEGASSYVALKSLAQDRIEWLFHIEEKQRVS